MRPEPRFGVGEIEIAARLASYAGLVEAAVARLQDDLKCGTNCGRATLTEASRCKALRRRKILRAVRLRYTPSAIDGNIAKNN